MILTRERILEEVRAGNIAIEPYDESLVGPASYDLHLGDEIRVIDPSITSIDLNDAADYLDFTTVQELDGPYPLKRGETIHGITREHIRLAPNICGWLEGRSRFARLGLMVHVTAGFIAPGVDNRQVLEISNVAPYTMNLHAGTRICQIVFQRTEGGAVYSGRFMRQSNI